MTKSELRCKLSNKVIAKANSLGVSLTRMDVYNIANHLACFVIEGYATSRVDRELNKVLRVGV